ITWSPDMNIAIIGAGGHGRVVLDIVRAAGDHRVLAFIDSNAALLGRRVDGVPVIGGPEILDSLDKHKITGAIVAIGDNGTRRAFSESARECGLELVNAVHPSAQLASTINLGRNVL